MPWSSGRQLPAIGTSRGFTEPLRRDLAEMASWYPQFTLRLGPSRTPFWWGLLRPYRTQLLSFRVVLIYGERAEAVPKVWLVDPEISKRTHPMHTHLNVDGSACTFFVPDRTYQSCVHDISRLVDLVGDWLRRHIYLERFHEWPGPEAPHEPAGVLAITPATAPCICGNGLRFGQCCRPQYEMLTTRFKSTGGLPIGNGADRRQLLGFAQALRRQIGPRRMADLLPDAGPPAWMLDLANLSQCGPMGMQAPEEADAA